MSLYTQEQLVELSACQSPAEMRKLTLKWEKADKASEEKERKQALAYSSLGKLYQRYSSQQSLLISKTDDKQGLELLNEYKECLPIDCFIAGKVEVHSKTGQDLLGLCIVRKIDGSNQFSWYAVGKEIKERAGKTTTSVGSILATACLGEYLEQRFLTDFPALVPVETATETILNNLAA